MIIKDNINLFWASVIVEELIRNNITQFYVSPGSRSTPFVIAITRNINTKCKIVYDERSAAFQAIGYAKSSGKAAVLICTSGSAVTHYYPAIIEAEATGIPLLIFSSDRPIELQNTGANQTINQTNIFNNHVNYFQNIDTPSESVKIEYLLSLLNYCINVSQFPKKGGVHLNFRFREPLEPTKAYLSDSYIDSIADWENSKTIFKQYNNPIFNSHLNDLKNNILNAKKPLIIVGRVGVEINLPINIPVFNDVQSNVIFSDNVINYYDNILLSKSISDNKPDLVIIIGDAVISKRLMKYINSAETNIISVMDRITNYDPDSNISKSYLSNYNQFEKLMIDINLKSTKWLEYWISNNSIVKDVLNDFNEFSEIYFSKMILQKLSDATIFISNSTPVRSFDMYAVNKSNVIYSNRGASGIDGIISTTIGISDGTNDFVYLVIGDLAFIHDLNSLTNIMKSKVKIILYNNNGGGIFNFLPIAKHEDVFTENFITPHTYSFDNIAKNFDIPYCFADNSVDFDKQLNHVINSDSPLLFEIRYDNKKNHQYYNNIQKTIKDKLNAEL
ncbi:2-succinyl-5-enolpyruvyl-6-hydroxy-3-cyclohexene-1-carboxylic-acid synthase [Candidatus Kapabacteria bacterium]|nr:2-succinyl-5-enolpyruvyl-6-hydroxy-3-cyclohexene-1-carboxylic-acid synthase [Candidatus Kapabacteria bacterium]